MRAVAEMVEANPYIPVRPTLKQLEFLAAPQGEKGYGGQVGGGKSAGLLIEALLPVQVRGYSGLILRKKFPDLMQGGGLITVAKEWLYGVPGVKWYERDKVFVFQKYQSRLQFGFLDREDHKFRYQGGEYQKICFDEATQFEWSKYSYLRTRLRRSKNIPVPPTMACATNPGGIGHNWFYRWFVKGDGVSRVFVPASIEDNPYLEKDEYVKLLQDLDPITRAQLLEGRWVVDETGRPFRREHFDTARYLPTDTEDKVLARKMFVDAAITDKKTAAFNAIVVLELLSSYKLRVRRVWREKCSFGALVSQIQHYGSPAGFNDDGLLDEIVIEDKANGPAVFQTIRDGQDPLLSRMVRPFMPVGSKGERYHQAAVWTERGCIELPYPINDQIALWLFQFEEELYEAPDGEYLDQADAFSMGVIFMEHYVSRGYWYRQRLAEQQAV